jgi:plastocyanin
MNTTFAPMAGGLLLLSITLAGCGTSSNGYGSNPVAPSPSPSPSPAPVAASLTIRIVAMDESNSFAPDSAEITEGQTIAFYNADSTTHRSVSDDGVSFDTGNLAPGATSAPITMSTAGSFAYHCAIHPTMVGKLTVSSN